MKRFDRIVTAVAVGLLLSGAGCSGCSENGDNAAPEFVSIDVEPDAKVPVGAQLKVTVEAMDPDGDGLQFNWESGPEDRTWTIDDTGAFDAGEKSAELVWTPEESDVTADGEKLILTFTVEDSKGATATDEVEIEVLTGEKPTVCDPGEVVGCREENTPSVDICNADGTEVEAGSCPSSPPQVCRDGECVEVDCIPGARRCVTESQPQRCNEAGTSYEDLEACSGGATCEEGDCLNRCQLAELQRSYIGCEYWSVQLDNALLNEGGVLDEDEFPPYALVLANTSTTYDTTVTVFKEDGVIAEAVASRTVGADIDFPGQDLVTVHSQVLDQNGNKLLDIDGKIEDIPLPKQSIMTLILPHRMVPFGESGITKTGYRVESTQPIVAYQFNPLCCNYNFTNDASLLLPTSALTENYMFLSYEVWTPSRGDTSYSPYITVMATEPDTEVEVKLKPSAQGRTFSEMIYPVNGTRLQGPDDNGVMRATLQPHEVLNVAAGAKREDLTGSRITASKPVSVFGGHTCAFIPDGNAACDHLEQQLFPVETWGRSFDAAPLKFRGDLSGGAPTLEGTYWKFLALEDDTRIETGININERENPDVHRQTSGAVKPCREFSEDPALGAFTLDAGQSCVFGSRTLFVAQSGRPFLMGAFLSGQGSVETDPEFGDHNGDPAFFLVPPREQYRTEYSFLAPETYFVSYVTVLIRPGFTVALDGMELDLTQFDYEELPQRDLARAHIPVEPGPHVLESVIPFGIVVYGLDDYVSYAFTGGLDLTKLNQID